MQRRSDCGKIFQTMKITEVLAAEHAMFLTVFDQIERDLPSLSTSAEVATMARIVEALLRGHAETETSLAYLALDHALAQNGELHRMHQDHHEIDASLKKAQDAESCAQARRLLKDALSVSREHFRLEERNVFPLLEKVLQPETLSQLGRAWSDRRAARTMSA